jgi:hypothetical protein
MADVPSTVPAMEQLVDEAMDGAMQEGDVFVPRDRRPRNRNGNCVWCATETCFWGAANLEAFAGITDRAISSGWHGAGTSNLTSYCQTVQVPCLRGSGVEFFKTAVANGTGAVGFIPGHAIFVCGIDDSSARIIDNNGSPEMQSWSRSKFDRICSVGVCPDCPPRSRWKPKLPKIKPPIPSPRPNHPPVNPAIPVQPPLLPVIDVKIPVKPPVAPEPLDWRSI